MEINRSIAQRSRFRSR